MEQLPPIQPPPFRNDLSDNLSAIPSINQGNTKQKILIAVVFFIFVGLAAYGVMLYKNNNFTAKDSNIIQTAPTPISAINPNLDSDKDGMSDRIEIATGTNPRNADSDSDSYPDLNEIKNGYSPFIAGSSGKYTQEQFQALKDKIKAVDEDFYESTLDVVSSVTSTPDPTINPTASPKPSPTAYKKPAPTYSPSPSPSPEPAAPKTWNSSPDNSSSYPDLDLHAYTPDGKHVGMNYATGVYEMQIPDANASGDMTGGEEWIFVPKDTEIKYYVANYDTKKYLEENPNVKPTDILMEYTTTIIEYGENPKLKQLPDGTWTITDRTVSEPQTTTIAPGTTQEIDSTSN